MSRRPTAIRSSRGSPAASTTRRRSTTSHGEGFPLVGGRIDLVDGRKVAVLVYRHNQHRIALTLWPSSASGNAAATVRQRDGFALADWRHAGFEMRAVADLAPGDMKSFAAAVDGAVDADR